MLKKRFEEIVVPDSKTPEKLKILYEALMFHPKTRGNRWLVEIYPSTPG